MIWKLYFIVPLYTGFWVESEDGGVGNQEHNKQRKKFAPKQKKRAKLYNPALQAGGKMKFEFDCRLLKEF